MRPEYDAYLAKPAFETNDRDLIQRTCNMLVISDTDFTFSSRCDSEGHWTYRVEVALRFEDQLKGIVEVLE